MDLTLDPNLFEGSLGPQVRVAPFTVLPLGARRSDVPLLTPSGTTSPFRVREFIAMHDGGWQARIGLYLFDNHEASVEMIGVLEGPRRTVPFEFGGRLALTRPDDASKYWMVCFEREQVKLASDAAGLDVFETLRGFGATAINERPVTVGLGRPDDEPCLLLFSPGNWLVPVITFALTRVLPICYHHRIAAA